VSISDRVAVLQFVDAAGKSNVQLVGDRSASHSRNDLFADVAEPPETDDGLIRRRRQQAHARCVRPLASHLDIATRRQTTRNRPNRGIDGRSSKSPALCSDKSAVHP
jgi:hypothetical protein